MSSALITILLVAILALLSAVLMMSMHRKRLRVEARAEARMVAEAERRSKEYELLTHIGQAVSSRLNLDEALRVVQKELGRLFDTRNFYVAFLQNGHVHFDLQMEDGVLRPKRSRPVSNGITEHILRMGQPLLVEEGMESVRMKLEVAKPTRPAKSFCGVPIVLGEKPIGVMAVLDYERERAFGKRDLDIMRTVAAQLAVVVENARVFAEEQLRARYLAFLNTVSNIAISTQSSEEMLADIVSLVGKNFEFDHVGIGILDYASKEIEIKAETGTAASALGRRIPLGVGIPGKVARNSETVLLQGSAVGNRLQGILPEARSVLCIPITYGESLLGVLNAESRRENAFGEPEQLILRTLADLLATALHNAFVFQTMKQQSITDGLTGIKTRRYFLEAMQSEWRRASRSGRSFSIVIIDLDKFKAVNDTMGHLEGDLVLARVGRLLEQKCRQSNVVARYGGDEFVILMPETTVDQAQTLCERLRLWVATDPMLSERQISGSFGIATFPLHGTTPEELFRVADAGMYQSKRAGGNHVSVVGGEGSVAVSSRQLVSTWVEDFLRREMSGPEVIDQLAAGLRKLSLDLTPQDRSQALRAALRSLALAAENRDVSSAGHGDSVARCVEMMLREMDLPAEDTGDLLFATRIHDLGKLVVPEAILNKPGALSREEYAAVKEHVAYAVRILESIECAPAVIAAVRHHHERFDGTGYPDGLRGETIPLWARLIAVAEAYANMTNERAYAALKSPEEAMAELRALAGSQFDPRLVEIFCRQVQAAGQPARAGAS